MEVPIRGSSGHSKCLLTSISGRGGNSSNFKVNDSPEHSRGGGVPGRWTHGVPRLAYMIPS